MTPSDPPVVFLESEGKNTDFLLMKVNQPRNKNES
jgi:hypothetical protein